MTGFVVDAAEPVSVDVSLVDNTVGVSDGFYIRIVVDGILLGKSMKLSQVLPSDRKRLRL